jgi:hypothetical protein
MMGSAAGFDPIYRRRNLLENPTISMRLSFLRKTTVSAAFTP